MAFRIYNTFSRKVEDFAPISPPSVGLYTCGPTVYNYAHIGNLRTYVSQDVLKRWLAFSGFKVKHVMNLTDVDDKTIAGAKAEGIPLQTFTSKYTASFLEDISQLNILKPEILTPATKNIPEMVSMIQTLLEKGFAYKSEDGSIYFNVAKFRNYGKLSNLKLKGLKAGARVKQDEYEKEDARDFALWKAYSAEDGNVFWETRIGKGRPGWHIECSAMSTKYLGQTFDIHSGGVDLIFPHHENEICQSESCYGKKFVDYWHHCEHLLVDGKRMAKSSHNFYTLRDVLVKGYTGRELRYFFVSVNYRSQLNFTFKALEGARQTLDKLDGFILRLKETGGLSGFSGLNEILSQAESKFRKAMDNDLNTPEALSALHSLISKLNEPLEKNLLSKMQAIQCIEFLKRLDSALGILDFSVSRGELGAEQKKLLAEREEFRKQKRFKEADEIRVKLSGLGVELFDTPQGVKWKITGKGLSHKF